VTLQSPKAGLEKEKSAEVFFAAFGEGQGSIEINCSLYKWIKKIVC
jgi:hypothetical protein